MMKILIEVDENKIADLAKVPVKVLGTEQNMLLNNLFTRDDKKFFTDKDFSAMTALDGKIAKAFQDHPEFQKFFTDKDFNAKYGINWDSVTEEKGYSLEDLRQALERHGLVSKEQLERLDYIIALNNERESQSPKNCIEAFAKLFADYDGFKTSKMEDSKNVDKFTLRRATRDTACRMAEMGIRGEQIEFTLLCFSPSAEHVAGTEEDMKEAAMYATLHAYYYANGRKFSELLSDMTWESRENSEFFLREEQYSRLRKLEDILEHIQKYGSAEYWPECAVKFAKSFTQEKLEGLQRILTPSGLETNDTAKLFEAASRIATFELIGRNKYPPKDVVNMLVEYSPMEGIADPRLSIGERTKTAMSIVLDAQREIEQGKGLDAGKEAAVSL